MRNGRHQLSSGHETAEDAAHVYDDWQRENENYRALNFPTENDYHLALSKRTSPMGRPNGNRSSIGVTPYTIGVTPYCERFTAETSHRGETFILGAFDTEKEAAEAHDKKNRELGRLRFLNYPSPDEFFLPLHEYVPFRADEVNVRPERSTANVQRSNAEFKRTKRGLKKNPSKKGEKTSVAQ